MPDEAFPDVHALHPVCYGVFMANFRQQTFILLHYANFTALFTVCSKSKTAIFSSL